MKFNFLPLIILPVLFFSGLQYGFAAEDGYQVNPKFIRGNSERLLGAQGDTKSAGTPVKAKDNLPKKEVLNTEERIRESEKKAARNSGVYDFLTVAFNDTLWREDNVFPEKHVIPGESLWGEGGRAIASLYPWAKEYIFREWGLPKLNGLNKWPAASEITVTLGYPSDESSALDDTGLGNLVREQVAVLAPRIKNSVGLALHFSPRQEEGKLIRIVFSEKFPLNNRFKETQGIIESSPGGIPPGSFEPYLFTAVKFTPFSRSQVDGYFLTDSKSNIELSICKIWPHFKDKNLILSLINECVMRSLGMPGLSKEDKSALLGDWNKPYDGISKRDVLDGKGAEKTLDAVWFRSMADGDLAAARDATSLRYVVEGEAPSPLKEVLGPSSYDLAHLRLLYCNELAAGDDKTQTLFKISKGSCSKEIVNIQKIIQGD